VAERETIRAMWQEYRRAVIPADAPPVQIVECRRAFYGGLWALMCRLYANADGTMTDTAAADYMKDLEAEMRRFKNSVGTALEGRE